MPKIAADDLSDLVWIDPLRRTFVCHRILPVFDLWSFKVVAVGVLSSPLDFVLTINHI
jgi:hypothetical protein